MESYLNGMRGHSINEPKLLRLMMLTNIQLGNNAANRSEDEKALSFFQNAQTQAEHLLGLSPDDLSIQEYSVNIRHCAARIYTKTGKFTQAEQLLNQALEISKKIVQAAPADMRKRTSLCETYKYMGELLQRQNKTAEAIKMYVSFLNEEENRDADLPGSTNEPTADYLEFRLSLASACEHLASALAQSGEYEQAHAMCEKGQKAISPIISDSADNKYDKINAYSPVIIPFLRQMASIMELSADLQIESQIKNGNLTFNYVLQDHEKGGNVEYNFVLSDYKEAIRIREELSQNDPFSVTFKLELATSYEKAGKGCLQMKNVKEAIEFFKNAEQLFYDIAKSNPKDRELQETYFRFNTDLALTHLNMNKPHDAVAALELKLDYLKEKERDLCEYPYFYIELRKTYQFLAETYLQTNKLEDSKTMFENSLRLLENENSSANDPGLSLSTVRNSLAYLYAKEGRYHEASELYEKAYPILERAAGNDPNNEALRRGMAMAKNTRALLNKGASKIKQDEDTLKQVKSIPPPASLKGCGIKFDKITLEPGNFDIESYEVKGDKALVLISYSEEIPKDYYSCLLSAAKTVEEAEKRIPAEVVFTAKKGRVYTGYVNGSWRMFRSYHYEESTDLLPLRNCKIEITLPEEGAVLDGKIAAPRSIPKNSRIEIKTDRRTLKYAIGEFALNAYLCRYKPEEKTAKIELSLPSPDNRNTAESIHMALSGADDFKNIHTTDAPLPRILFMEKTGKTYHGVFQGYLYLYKSAPMKEGQYESEDTLIQRETLQTITISLP